MYQELLNEVNNSSYYLSYQLINVRLISSFTLYYDYDHSRSISRMIIDFFVITLEGQPMIYSFLFPHIHNVLGFNLLIFKQYNERTFSISKTILVNLYLVIKKREVLLVYYDRFLANKICSLY